MEGTSQIDGIRMHPPCEVKNVVEVNQWIWTLDACTSKSRGQHQHVPTISHIFYLFLMCEGDVLDVFECWKCQPCQPMSAFQPDSHSIALSMVPEGAGIWGDELGSWEALSHMCGAWSFAELCGASLASSCTDSVCIFWTFWSWLELLKPQSLGVGSDIDGATGCQRPVCRKLQRREARCVFGKGFLRDSSWSGVFVTGVKWSVLTSGRTYPFGDTGLTVYSSPFSEAGNCQYDFTIFYLSFSLICSLLRFALQEQLHLHLHDRGLLNLAGLSCFHCFFPSNFLPQFVQWPYQD